MERAPGRECGPCTLCCKVLEVSEIAKPYGTWCSHCTQGKGCGIYETRPESCRIFDCAWLQGTGGPAMRPLDSHIVMTGTASGEPGLVMHLDPGFPDAHRAPEPAALIRDVVARGWPVVVCCGRTRTLIKANGERSFEKPA